MEAKQNATKPWEDPVMFVEDIEQKGRALERETRYMVCKPELHCCGEDLRSVQCDLQLDLCKVQDWLQANRLQLNVSKSVIMLYSYTTNYVHQQSYICTIYMLYLIS